MLKTILLTICLVLVPTIAMADVSAKVISYEKEIQNDNAIIKVITEYTYPDGKKVLGTTRYGYNNFSKQQVETDVQTHCETITKYYIKVNRDTVKVKKEEIIDEFITDQDTKPDKDKITSITYTMKDLYIDDLGITIPADGVVETNYQ